MGLVVLVTPGPCSVLSHSSMAAPTRRRMSYAKETLSSGTTPSSRRAEGQCLSKDLPFSRTHTLSPAAISDTAEGTGWLVTGDSQPSAAQCNSNQKKTNEVLCCPLAPQEQHKEGVHTLLGPCKVSGLPQASAPQSLPGTTGCKPHGGAGRPCQHPAQSPRHDKRLLSQETAGQEKTRAGRM